MKLKTGKKRSESILTRVDVTQYENFADVTQYEIFADVTQYENFADVTQYENFATTFSPCKINFLDFIDFNHRPGTFL